MFHMEEMIHYSFLRLAFFFPYVKQFVTTVLKSVK